MSPMPRSLRLVALLTVMIVCWGLCAEFNP